MSLWTAHRLLIASAVGCFLFYGAWEVRHYVDDAEGWALVRGAIATAGALGLAFYLRSVWRRGRSDS